MKSKKIRKDRIKSKMKDIIDSVNIIGDNLPLEFEDFASLGLIKEGIYKKMEFAIECVIDICNILNSDLDLGAPESEDQILIHLDKAKIFDKKIINLINDIKKFRNVLVHKYGEIDDERAYADIKEGLKDFGLILNEIEKFISKR